MSMLSCTSKVTHLLVSLRILSSELTVVVYPFVTRRDGLLHHILQNQLHSPATPVFASGFDPAPRLAREVVGIFRSNGGLSCGRAVPPARLFRRSQLHWDPGPNAIRTYEISPRGGPPTKDASHQITKLTTARHAQARFFQRNSSPKI